MSFVKSEEKFTNLMTFSYFETKLKIDRVIKLNIEKFKNELTHILSTMISVGDIYAMNNELETRFGEYINIKLDPNMQFLYLNDLQMEFDITSLKDDFVANKAKESDNSINRALEALYALEESLNKASAFELIKKAKDKKELSTLEENHGSKEKKESDDRKNDAKDGNRHGRGSRHKRH